MTIDIHGRPHIPTLQVSVAMGFGEEGRWRTQSRGGGRAPHGSQQQQASSRGGTRPRCGIVNICSYSCVTPAGTADSWGGRGPSSGWTEWWEENCCEIFSQNGVNCLQEVGSFVVRSSKGSLVLSCRDSENVKHIKLGEEGDQVHLPSST